MVDSDMTRNQSSLAGRGRRLLVADMPSRDGLEIFLGCLGCTAVPRTPVKECSSHF